MTKLSKYLNTMENVAKMNEGAKVNEQDGVNTLSTNSECVTNAIYTGEPKYIYMSVEEHAKIKAQLHTILNLVKSSRSSSPETRLVLAEQLYIELYDIEQVFYPKQTNLFHSPQVRFLRNFYEEIFHNVREIIRQVVAL